MREYGLPAYDAEVLTSRKDVADYYEGAVHTCPSDPKILSNWVMDSVLRVIKDEKLDTGLKITQWPCPPEHLGALVRLINEGKISGKIAKTVFETMVRTGEDAIAIVRREGLTQVADAGALASMVASAIAGNPRAVEDYRKGKTAASKAIVGHVMKASGGRANPALVSRLVEEELEKLTKR